MIKIVTKEDGYSLLFEKNDEDINCMAYETGRHMSGQEVGNALDISRASVSQTLKKSIRRIYYILKKKSKNNNSLDLVCAMASVFNVKDDSQYNKFFKLLPNEVKKEVKKEALKNGYFRN